MVLAELGGKLRDSLRKLQTGGQGDVTKAQLQQILNEIARALMEADVSVKLVMTLRDKVQSKVEHLLRNEEDEEVVTRRHSSNLSKTVQRAVVDELVALLSPGGDVKGAKKVYTMKRGKPNVILFLGLQGAGKTTTIAKFANYYQRRGWKTAMVCADTFRAGAFDQLKQNSTKLRVPFYGSYTEADPVIIAEKGVNQFIKERYEIIIVDTSGRHKQEEALFEEMQEIAAAVQPDNCVLVVDATQGQAVYDQALAFHNAVDVGSVIITKLDGHAKGGGALSAVSATQSPIIFLGSGEHFDDLEPFNAQSFVSKLLGFGDIRGLMDAMNSVSDGKSQEELMKKMSRGEFTLRDMYNQFSKVMNLGPMNKLMGMIPGMPDYLMPQGEESTHRLRKFMVMMDSMSNAELDGKVDLRTKYDPQVEKRIRRIAAGSGSHPNEVKMLLVVHKQFEGMVSKMGKSGIVGKNAQARQQQLAAQIKKNPNFIQQRLNQMDPKMLQQMGGREKVAAMMQQMAKGGNAGGMPDMDALMNGGMPGGMPGMGGMDMGAMMKMAQAMGMEQW
ncbi:signal recognition particle subunit SRP54 [Fistulifera solaris]|uniref:signal-recognition-particle GTPase n=1 Tax=Fistulifera solaris TaxID=1519565 RepID=A0A1Z5JT64_FISSO|nr:signal recognition particle subunit SRP54 [Fistulifera solaris]|eukprot:GAX17215.1 signal recognition particle subunit SRP54 [Fistulifera solaris]